MSRIFTITIAYCPAALLARSLILYDRCRYNTPYRHIVVQGHYPINEKKNTNDIKLITQCFPDIELWDPGRNLGSAQSQNWVLQRLDINDDDYFINLDPDSACLEPDWDEAMASVLDNDESCVLISCFAPMVERYLRRQNRVLAKKTIRDENGGFEIGIPDFPLPFNLSMWRYSFIKAIGGIPQLGLFWGETEGPFGAHCRAHGKYHAYLLDYMEDELGKQMQDVQQAQWKDLHMRVSPDKQFLGSFDEYLRWKHPELIDLTTCRDLTDLNFP